MKVRTSSKYNFLQIAIGATDLDKIMSLDCAENGDKGSCFIDKEKNG